MSALRFTPTGTRILVEPLHGKPYVGTIELPETVQEQKPAEAMVVAIGARNKLPLRVGDRVVTERYNGSEVRIGEGRYRLLEAVDILAIVEDAAA